MDRRSFLIGLGSTGLSTSVPLQQRGSEATDTEAPGAYWNALGREEKMLRLAECVVPGADPEELTILPADLNGAAPVYELYQSEPAGTPFVNWLTERNIIVTPSDVAVSGYAITEKDKAGDTYPHYLDGVVIAIPPGEINEIVSAVKGWEDNARAQASNDQSEGALSHNRGLSRYLMFTDPLGYRIQRIRILGDRMLVIWVEGVYEDGESFLPLLVGKQIEKEILLRRVRTHLDDGNTIPDEPIVLKRPRWRQ